MVAFPTGVKAYWKLENINDSIGNYPLTNNGTTTFSTGKINNAATFNGSSQSLNNNSVWGAFSYPRSYAGWVRFDTLSADQSIFSIGDGSIHYYTLKLRSSDAHIVFRSNNNTQAGDVDTGITAVIDTWYHVAVVQHSATSVSLYVKGTKTNTTATTFSATVSQFYMGYLGRDSFWYLDGKIDEVGFWDKALSDTEVTDLYNSGNGITNYLTLGTVSYYKLDESSGDASDSVGSNILTNVGTTTYSVAKINNGAVFNGSSQYFTQPATGNISGNFSISAWIKFDTIAASCNLFTDWGASDNKNIRIYFDSADAKIKFYRGNGGANEDGTAAMTAALSATTWYHVVFTQSGTTKSIYVNAGTPTTATATYTGAQTGEVMWIGVDHGGAANFFDGTIDEVAFFNRALSASELLQIYNSGTGLQYPFPLAPSVGTSAVTNIDLESATFNGTVGDDYGDTISERGFVYSTTINPTTADTKVIVSGTLGSYSGNVTGLTLNTTYYVRAYATNATGTGYGSNKTFTTLTVGAKTFSKNINAIEGKTYAVSCNVTGTTGTITVKLGTTGTTSVINAGTGVSVFQGTYNGLTGLIFEASEGFDGTVDDIMWVLITGDASIDWTKDTLTNVFPINSSVKFKRVESEEITQFMLYRYLDVLFKDLDGYVTLTITEEANDGTQDRSKEFVVGNITSPASPFIKKKISMLSKNQALIVSFSNNKLNETFTICQYSLSGEKKSPKLYKLSKIISI